VDYVSGASIAVPARIWGEMGGFDPIYKPAYCEDSDLAFRLRKAGLRTLFTPGSQIIHHEGRSHGRDTGEGIKAHQVTNQRHFAERWGPTLARENFPNGVEVLRARDRSRDKPHILVVDHYVPQMDKDAGSRTIFQFLRSLVDAGWSVTFWPENLYRDPIYTPIVQGLGIEVIYGVKYVDKFSDFLRSRSGLYDAVLLSRPHVAAHFIDDVRTLTDARILYYGHDVHFERMKAQRDIANTVDDGAVEAIVGHHQVRPTAEHQRRVTGSIECKDGVDELLLGAGGGPVPCRAAESKGGVIGQPVHCGLLSRSRDVADRGGCLHVQPPCRTSTRVAPSTFWSAQVASMVTVARSPSTAVTVARNVTVAPVSSSGTRTGLVNRVE